MALNLHLFLIKALLLFGIAIALPYNPGSGSSGAGYGGLLLGAYNGGESALTNVTASSLASRTVGPQISCDGSTYRTGLRLLSCQDAVHQISQDPRLLRFALRGTGEYDVALPSRFISCKYCTVPFCFPLRPRAKNNVLQMMGCVQSM